MPFTKSLHKVNKKLSKQSAGSLHVKGRKFKQLNRAHERQRRLDSKKQQYAEQKNHELLFYLYIQETINESKDQETFSAGDMRNIVDQYIHRNDEDIAAMDAERRKGRPMTNKHQIMLEKRKHDEHLFKTGFRIPDLGDELTVTRLRGWNGTAGSSTAWKFTVVNDDTSDDMN